MQGGMPGSMGDMPQNNDRSQQGDRQQTQDRPQRR